MNSREKVLEARGRLLALRPEDESSARDLQLLSAFAPLIVQALPDDPDELDQMLANLARGALACRSDGAPVMQVFEWDKEAERWV